MRENVALRRYRPDDLDAIYRLDELCFAPPFRFDRASMRRFAEARHAIALVANEETAGNTKLLGFVIVHLERSAGGIEAYVVALDVSPEWRRVGIAALLMEEAEDLSRGAGAQSIALHVFTANDGAIRFYEAQGYKRARLDRNFYGTVNGERLDAHLYRKDLRSR